MTNEQVKADIAAHLPDNTTGAITPAILRTELGTMVDYSDTTAEIAIDAHNSDPAAHGLGWRTIPLSFPEITIHRTGTPYNQVSLAAAEPESLLTARVPVATIPEFTEITGFIPCGTTPGGEAVLRNSSGTKDLLLVSGAGVISRKLTPNVWLDNVWFDSGGNCYGGHGKDVYRSPRGQWNFEKVFEFASASSGVAIFGYTADDRGGVFVAEYSNEPDTGKQVWRSVDFGKTWNSTVVDVGQRHHHGIHWHPYDGKLYLLAGEPHYGDTDPEHQGGKLLVSEDRGATFTQIHSFTDSNPTSIVSVGRLLIIGADGGASRGFYSYDPTGSVIRHIDVVNDSFGEASSGYYYKLISGGNGRVWAPAEPTVNNVSTARSIWTLSSGLTDPISVITAYRTRQLNGNSVVGPDSSGAIYVGNSDNSGTIVINSGMVETRFFSALTTVKPTGFVANANWDTAPGIVSGVTFSGRKILSVSSASGRDMSSPAYIPVSPSKKYRAACVIQRGSGDANTLMFSHVWYSGTTFLSITSNAIVLSDVGIGEFARIISPPITPNPSADRVVLSWVLWRNASAENAHRVVSDVSFFEESGSGSDIPWSPSGPASEEYEIPVNGLLVDRIYLQCPPSVWGTEGVNELISGNGFYVGLRGSTIAGGAKVVVSIDGQDTELPGAPWGSRVDGQSVFLMPDGLTNGEVHSLAGLAAPLVIAVSTDELIVINPENNVATVFQIPTTGNVTLTGTAIHAVGVSTTTPISEHAVRSSL